MERTKEELSFTCKANQCSYLAKDTVHLRVSLWTKAKMPLDIFSPVSFNLKKLEIRILDYKQRKLKSLINLKFSKELSQVTGEYETERFIKPGKYFASVFYNGITVASTSFFILSEVRKKTLLLLSTPKTQVFLGDILEFKVKLQSEQKLLGKFDLNVKLTNEEGEVLKQSKIQLIKSKADFSLQNPVGKGFIYCTVTCKIGKKNIMTFQQISILRFEHLQLQIIPEGGRFVFGKNIRVFFKAGDSQSYPDFMKITLRKGAQDQKVQMGTYFKGIGSFQCNFKKGEEYSLLVQDFGGQEKEFPLDFQFESDIQMKIQQPWVEPLQDIKIDLSKGKSLFGEKLRLSLVDKTKEVYAKILKLKIFKKTTHIRRKKLGPVPGGVYTVQLAREKNPCEILQEALVFLSDIRKIPFSVSFNRTSYCIGEQIQYTITFPQKSSKILSISVFDDKSEKCVVKRTGTQSELESLFFQQDLQGSSQILDYLLENNLEFREKHFPHFNLETEKQHLLRMFMVQKWRSFFSTFESLQNLSENTLKETPKLHGLLFFSCKNLRKELGRLLPASLGKGFQKRETIHQSKFGSELHGRHFIERKIFSQKYFENIIIHSHKAIWRYCLVISIFSNF